jgi:hypothetical protein
MHRGGPELAGSGMPWPSKAQTLLLRAAIGPAQGVRAAFDAWRAMTDIEAPVDGGTYRLLPLLYARLSALDIDDPLMGRLKGVYRRAWYENNLLFHRVVPAVAALETAGIKTMLLKGTPIALTYHASHATRPMADLDLMVRTDQADAARHLLAKLGWKATTKHPARELPDLHAQDLRNAEGTEIDLHWHCLREAPGDALDAWFWATAKPFTFEGVKTLQPGATQMLVQTVLHGLRSNLEPSIRWVSDAAALMSQTADPIDWSGIVVLARQHRLACRLSMGLGYLVEQFGQSVPGWVIEQLDAAGISFVERVENIVYLGPAQRMYSPYLYPLVDYWRYRRVRGAGRFWREFPEYLSRRWQLRHPLMIPVAAGSVLLRQTRRALR